MSPLIAHQGGWDEILMFAVPILIALGVVKWAERRGARKRATSAADRADGPAEGPVTQSESTPYSPD